MKLPSLARLRKIALQLLVILVIVGAVFMSFMGPSTKTDAPAPRGRRGGGAASGPVAVLVAPVTLADVPVYVDGVGTARSLNSVTLRPQVDGLMTQVLFTEGQDVKKGDVLARIDPTTYQAQLDQAVAKKAQDEAQLENARRDLERYQRLMLTNAVTSQQADTQRASVAQLVAQVQSDQASIDNYRAILAYTQITSPIDGRTGIRNVDPGNLVHASDATGIVTISQIRPIAVVFNIAQQNLGMIKRGMGNGPLSVEAMNTDGSNALDTGSLQVIDNQVDAATGTVKLKAEFPNAREALWPGAFVNVRLRVNVLSQVVTIPSPAVQRGPSGPFVYVVTAENVASLRPVTLTRQDDARAVIATGLAAGEQVVTTGFAQLADGTKVVATAETEAAPTPAPARQRRDGSPPGERRRQRDAPNAGGVGAGGSAQSPAGNAPSSNPPAATAP